MPPFNELSTDQLRSVLARVIASSGAESPEAIMIRREIQARVLARRHASQAGPARPAQPPDRTTHG